MKEDNPKQKEYNEKTSVYRSSVETLLRETNDADTMLKKGMPDPEFMKIKLSITMLTLASNYLAMFNTYQAIFKQRNEDVLNEARKSINRSITYLEEVVTRIVDAPFSDYEEGLAKIAAVSPAQRYSLVEKLGLSVKNLKEAYGKNSKWVWTFVELEGRYAVVAKNLINLRDYFTNSDFESPHYEPTVRHIRLVKELLERTADGYRKKYELSTKNFEDFKMGINFLSALKRLHIFSGDQQEAVTAKKKIETWTGKLAADMAAQKKAQEALNR